MTTKAIVDDTTDAREAEKPLSLIGMTAQLVLFWGEHTLSAPQDLYADGKARILSLHFGTREQLDAWFRALGPRPGFGEVRSQPYDDDGKPTTLHNAPCKRWGWSINLSAKTPVATEKPEHTLTSVEREALVRASEDGKELHDATVGDEHDGCGDEPSCFDCGHQRCEHSDHGCQVNLGDGTWCTCSEFDLFDDVVSGGPVVGGMPQELSALVPLGLPPDAAFQAALSEPDTLAPDLCEYGCIEDGFSGATCPAHGVKAYLLSLRDEAQGADAEMVSAALDDKTAEATEDGAL